MSDAFLILNAGSSSLKFSVFGGAPALEPLIRGQVEGLGAAPRFRATDAAGNVLGEKTWEPGKKLAHVDAVRFLLQWGREEGLRGRRVAAAGHRVVHGGMKFTGPVRVDAQVLKEIEALAPLAPLHLPHNLAAIKAVAEGAPDVPQVACFDTSFHRTQPHVAQAFAIPHKYTDGGIRRYGFHGLSYEYIASALPRLDAKAAAGRTIVAHLGAGASMCAMLGGKSVATTMGLSALDGLVMSTRCGSIDPAVLLFLNLHEKMGMDRVFHLLHEESGLLGVSGISGDMRTLLASGEPRAKEAVDLFVYRAAREIGSLAAALGGLDAVIFTGGIGENAPAIRAAICKASAWLGIEADDAANGRGGPRISKTSGRVSAWVVPTNEELMIARHTADVLAGAGRTATRSS